MNKYLTNCLPDEAMSASASYLERNTHYGWIVYQEIPEGQSNQYVGRD